MKSPRIDPNERFGIEYRPPGGRSWKVLGTVGSRAQAEWWLVRFHAGGDFRIRSPRKAGTATIARLRPRN